MNYSQLSILISALFLLLLASSCSDSHLEQNINADLINTIGEDKLYSATRAVSEETTRQMSFTVIYSGDLNAMLADDNHALNTILNTYDLAIDSRFEIDEEHKGIIIIPILPVDNPIALGKTISLIDEVMMVEVENAKQTNHNDTI